MKHIKSRVWAFVLLALSMVLPSAVWADGEHQLSVKAMPTMAGTFNTSAATLAAGETIHLYAYANSSFTFVHWTDETGTVVSEQSDFTYTMPDRDVQLTAAYEYNPANPANPAHNYWNSTLGEVIVDDFTTGQLQTAVRNAIDGSANSEVMMITVAGVINSNDFGIINNYSNCTLLDLSRVSGVSAVPSYAFDYTSLESVYLPASIETIGYQAFYQCQQLSSLIVYAMTPPTLDSNVFTGVPEGLVVYVPAAAIAQYQEADGWKNFTILPIQEDIRSISVSLPEGSVAADYAKMWLELTNTKSGQRMHYVMTDRTQYTFSNIIRNTTWNVTLRNERGDVFGQINSVEVSDEDVSVVFSSLSKPQSVALSVLTPDGQDVTAQTQVTWTDAAGNYLSQGASLSGLPVGYQASYRVILPQELAMTYDTPQQANYVLTEDGNSITCQLTAIPLVQISGKVKDQATNLPLSGATVSVSQTFGGKYSKTLNTKTDGSGMFTIEVTNVPTSVAFAATDYISQTLDFANNEWNELNEFLVPDVLLRAITGATISIGFTYTTCSAEGEEAETQSWYSDYNNIDYALYNETKQQTISQYNVQYPQIVLLEEVEDGDVLRLTATSRTSAFMPVTATATIAEQTASVTFDIVELGKISSSFTTTGNAAVVGSLYDGAGKLLKTYSYANASLTISDLADGNYTLVSMGSSRLFNTIYDLVQLPQTGLVEGTDYVKNMVNVQSGVVCQITIDEVPTLDESKLYYTGENTSFTVNKPSIVAGNYLTLTGHIDFKPAYATCVSNVQLIVDLPESCQFVENSVMVGNSTSSYTLNGSRITIPMARYTDRVRFCIIPTLGGDYAPSAFAQFDLDGETVIQPIGSANYMAKDLSISVPSTVAKTTIPVSGTAIGASAIEIYDNDVMIGQTTSLANGTWATTCELNEPYNLSRHTIYAKVTTKDGLGLQSETLRCLYDKNTIEVKTVTMINTAHGPNSLALKDYVTVFDFQNPPTSLPPYWYWPNYPDFTFIVDFTNNDPSLVSEVTLYVFTDNDKVVTLHPQYDEKQDAYVVSSKFDSYSLPTNVNVDYTSLTIPQIDKEQFNEPFLLYESIKKDISEEIEEIENIFNSGSQEVIDNYMERIGFIDEYYENIINVDSLYYIFSNMTEQELDSYVGDMEWLDSITVEVSNILSSFNYDDNWEEIRFGDAIYKRSIITDIDSVSLINQGYDCYVFDNNSSIYIRQDSLKYDFIDVSEGVHFSIEYNTPKEHVVLSRKKADIFTSENLKNWTGLLCGAVEHVEEVFGNLKDIIDNLTKPLKIKEEILALKKIQKMQAKAFEKNPAMIKILREEIEQIDKQLSLTRTSINGLKKVAAAVTKYMPVAKYASIASDAIVDLDKLYLLYKSIPDPCEEDDENATKYQNDVWAKAGYTFGYYMAYLAYDVNMTAASVSEMAAAIPTGGATIVPAIITELAKFSGEILANYVKNQLLSAYIKDMDKKIDELQCKKEHDPNPKPKQEPGPNPYVGHVSDPSGFVYEGVTSNRIEGVTATAYYKEIVEDMYGDLHENIVKWDAKEYAQENPLFTDEYGMYAWDVPNGLWQVKFEKEGYETTYSEWLPVPPPQLDVNIAMKQNVQPMVKIARAYEDAVEVEFDKYMMPELLANENIIVMQNGMAVAGTVELLNEEVSYEGETETFASKVRFNAEQPFTEQEITLMVNNRVKSYAGIRMQDNFQQTFTIEQEIKQIISDSLKIVGYGKSSTLVVQVLPTSASKNKALIVKTSSPMILSLESEQVAIGDDGKAEITIMGELPGTAALTFSVEGTDKEGLTIVSVEVNRTVATPTASIASGSVVEKDTQVALSCATQGATIFYTLDGSCPCVDSDARNVYDGTPITIGKNTVIKAMAAAPNMDDSDIATFVYIVTRGDVNDDLVVDTQDAIKVIQYYLLKDPSNFNVNAADVNGDGVVDTQDAIKIIKIYLKKE